MCGCRGLHGRGNTFWSNSISCVVGLCRSNRCTGIFVKKINQKKLRVLSISVNLQQNSFTFLMKKHNFGAGPSILPRPVYEKGAEAILDFNYSGVSLLEMSHRSPEIVDIMQTARNLVLELAQLQGKGYQVLFLQGGASLQFAMVAANLLQNKAAYLNTGTWANNVI